MKTLRTPDERFDGLPDYPFAANYAEISDQDDDEPNGTLRVHYLDEGPADAAPIVLLHGEPSWSYLYRKMIPALVAAGHRCIVPDLVGFGKSDKPTEKRDYTYGRHVAWMEELLIDTLDVTGATFFGQDWGGLVGLRVVAANPDRFERVVIGNTGLPTGERSPSAAFMAWQKFSQETPVFDIGFLLQSATNTTLTEGEVAAYDAPFPDDSFKEGARIFPSLVPTSPDDPAADANKAAWEVFKRWDKPFICCSSDGDPVTAGGDKPFLALVPGAKGQPHITVEGANHFFQEDAAPELAQLLIDVIELMATVERSVVAAAPPSAVWAVLADFAAISSWAPNVDHSCLLTEQESGVGAVRRIQAGRTTLVETVTTWTPEEGLTYSITGLPPVIRSVTNTWRLAPRGAATAVTLTTEIDAGPRPPQKLIAKVVGRKFGSVSDEMLTGLTDHVTKKETAS